MRPSEAFVVGLACAASVGLWRDPVCAGDAPERLRHAEQAPVAAPGDGRSLWRRALEAERFPDSRLDGTLTTVTASGETVSLRLHLVGRLADHGVSRMLLMRIASGGPLGGTAVLTIERQGARHDLWIYMPALGTPRRLFGENLDDSFLGSEFRLGDLFQPDPADYTVTVRGSDGVEGRPCWVVDAVPRDPTAERMTGLAHQVLWIGKDDGLEYRVEQFDRSGRPFKAAAVSRWVPVLGGRGWLATERSISNLQTGARTSLVFEHVEVAVGVDAAYFGPQHLADRSW
jgi:uncharacterized protein